MDDQIPAKVARLIQTDGTRDSAIEGVQLFRSSEPIERVEGVLDPSLCIVVQGEKRAFLDGRSLAYGPSKYLCASMPIPVEGEALRATRDYPLLGLFISLESRVAAEFIVQCCALTPEPPKTEGPPAGLAVGEWTEQFTVALGRLLDVVDSPVAVELVGEGRLRELLYAVSQGPVGPALRRSLGGSSQQLGPVLKFMRENLAQPLSVDELAQRAGMSRAAFDRQFKTTTTLSPLKYLQALRVNQAARSIATGSDIGHAATHAGYSSPSQFSREFKRHFGMTPRDWAKSKVAGQVAEQPGTERER